MSYGGGGHRRQECSSDVRGPSKTWPHVAVLDHRRQRHRHHRRDRHWRVLVTQYGKQHRSTINQQLLYLVFFLRCSMDELGIFMEMLYVKFRHLRLQLLNSKEVSIILNHICTEWYYLVLRVWFYNNFLAFKFLLTFRNIRVWRSHFVCSIICVTWSSRPICCQLCILIVAFMILCWLYCLFFCIYCMYDFIINIKYICLWWHRRSCF